MMSCHVIFPVSSPCPAPRHPSGCCRGEARRARPGTARTWAAARQSAGTRTNPSALINNSRTDKLARNFPPKSGLGADKKRSPTTGLLPDVDHLLQAQLQGLQRAHPLVLDTDIQVTGWMVKLLYKNEKIFQQLSEKNCEYNRYTHIKL